MRRRWMVLAPVAIVGMALFIALGGAIVRWLWNWLTPPLFGWHPITFWQALAMLALCRILFGGLGPGGSRRSGVRGRIADRMAERVAEGWEAMTPEERERFRQRLRERFGFDPATSEPKAT